MPDEEQRIAWELHVELATRVTGVPLAPHEGVDQEAVASLEQLSRNSRQALSRLHPHPDPSTSSHQIESIVRSILTDHVDAFVARWKHDLYADEQHVTMRAELEELREELLAPIARLAELAGASSLLPSPGS